MIQIGRHLRCMFPTKVLFSVGNCKFSLILLPCCINLHVETVAFFICSGILNVNICTRGDFLLTLHPVCVAHP